MRSIFIYLPKIVDMVIAYLEDFVDSNGEQWQSFTEDDVELGAISAIAERNWLHVILNGIFGLVLSGGTEDGEEESSQD